MLSTLELIQKRSKGKYTRFKVVLALLILGPGYHSGEDVRVSFLKVFPKNHFDFLYLESLCYSYKIVLMKPQSKRSLFFREARNTSFKIREGYYESILEYFQEKSLFGEVQSLLKR